MPLGPEDTVPDHVHQTVQSLGTLHQLAQANVGPHQRTVEWVAAKLGRPATIYVTCTLVAGWVALNAVLAAHGQRPIDAPPFEWLQGVLTFASLLMTTIVLTTQARQTRHTEQRSRLDLQVNLLSDAKIAKLIALVEELRRDMPLVPNRVDPVAEAMKETVDPARVLEAIEKTLESTEMPEEGGPRRGGAEGT
jgi:uncharacterized membrane protein